MQFYWFRDRVIQGKFLVYWMAGEHNLAYYFTKHHPTSHHWLKLGAHISYPQWKPVSMHATWHPMTCECVLNPSPPGERDDRWKKYPSSEGRKRTTDGRRQIGLLGIHDISGDNISLRAPLLYCRCWSTNAESPSYDPITSTHRPPLPPSCSHSHHLQIMLPPWYRQAYNGEMGPSPANFFL